MEELDAGSTKLKLLMVTLSIPLSSHIKSRIAVKVTVVVTVLVPTAAVIVLPFPLKVRVRPAIVALIPGLPENVAPLPKL